MKKIRISSGYGFYGDVPGPVKVNIERGAVQYVASDHLSELTLAILQKDRLKDPRAGYTRDIVPMLSALYPAAQPKGIKFLMNAGGLNPEGAQAAVMELFKKKGLSARIAMVTGDGVLERIDELKAAGQALAHMDTGADIASVRERLLFANAYLGAQPLVEALRQGADVIITGRVADAALFLAPLIYEFGWRSDEYDKLAQGLLVGHLLECSNQGSGGNFGGGDWQTVPDLAHTGFPIAEVSEDGAALITKVPGTGGKVSFDTVRQQMLYETHDPSRYYSPDVILDFTTVKMRDWGEDRVEVKGATGRAPTDILKVVAGYHDGYMGHAMIGYSWPDALKKAQAAADIIRIQMQEAGMRPEQIHVEYLGYNSLMGPVADAAYADQLNEVYLRFAIRTPDKALAERLPRLFPPLALGGPPYASGFRGVPAPQVLLGIWPTLVKRELVESRVKVSVVEV